MPLSPDEIAHMQAIVGDPQKPVSFPPPDNSSTLSPQDMQNMQAVVDGKDTAQTADSANKPGFWQGFGQQLKDTYVDTPIKFAEGMGRTALQRGVGIDQAIYDALPQGMVSDKTKQDATAMAAKLKSQEDTGLMGIGERVAGDPLSYTPLGEIGEGVKGAAALAGKLGGLGALSGATTPLAPGDSRLKNTVIGGAIGAGSGVAAKAIFAIPEAVSTLIQKLANINPEAAKDFLDTGVHADLSNISDSPGVKLLDRFLSKFPGGAGVMQKSADKTLSDIQNLVNNAGASSGTTPQEVGETLIQGGKNYIQKFKDVSQKLYNQVDKYIPPESQVNISTTRDALQNLTVPVPGAENLSATLTNPRINSIKSALEKDLTPIFDPINGTTGKNTIPYSTLSDVRSQVGRMLNSSELLTDIPRGELKQLYGALSNDMQNAASTVSPKALNAFNRANNFYREGSTKIDETLQNVITKANPEKVYQAATEGTALGGTKISNIMSILKPAEQDIVRGTVLKRLGQATPGMQNAEGNAFSVTTYLTNWNKLSSEAKNALFGSSGQSTRNSLDTVARMADRIKGVSRFSNTSNTASQFAAGALFFSALQHPIMAGGAVSSTFGAAKLITNNDFLQWLSKSASARQVTPQMLASNIRNLKGVAARNPDIAPDIAKYITLIGTYGASKQQQDQGQQP